MGLNSGAAGESTWTKNKSPTGQIMSEWGFVAQRLTGNHWRLARDEMLRLLSRQSVLPRRLRPIVRIVKRLVGKSRIRHVAIPATPAEGSSGHPTK